MIDLRSMPGWEPLMPQEFAVQRNLRPDGQATVFLVFRDAESEELSTVMLPNDGAHLLALELGRILAEAGSQEDSA